MKTIGLKASTDNLVHPTVMRIYVHSLPYPHQWLKDADNTDAGIFYRRW